MAFWVQALELLPKRLRSRTIFGLLSSAERGAALRALPAVECALLYENFSRPWGKAGFAGGCLGDARGADQSLGRWVVGPGTFVPPHMERCLAGPANIGGLPVSVWCLRMANQDPLSDFDPSGLVWCFPRTVRPSIAFFRCRPSASRPHRCGGVFALAAGLGNDKGPEGPAIFLHFSRDPEGRSVNALEAGGRSIPLGQWAENEWCTVRIRIDWDRRVAHCQLWCEAAEDPGGPGDGGIVEVPFKSGQCVGCRYLLLYNQTCDFEVQWTDIFVA